jgi:hypothetical protein
MQAVGRDGGAARHASGAIMFSTIMWKQSAPPKSGRGEAVRRRARPPRLQSTIASVCTPEALLLSEDAHGWTVLATTLRSEECADVEMLQAYQEQHIRWNLAFAG